MDTTHARSSSSFLTLYPYQEQVVETLTTHLQTHDRALVVMATGLGKTITIASWLKTTRQQGERTLFLCHDTAILAHAMGEFAKVYGDTLTMGFFHGGEKTFEDVDILFATFQTMRTWSDAFLPEEFTYLLVDESHHAKAETHEKVITHFTPRVRVAFTATPDRMDTKDIRDLFGDEVVHLSLEQGIANGWLAQVEYRVLTSNLDIETLEAIKVRVTEGDTSLTLEDLNKTLFIPQRDEEVAATILAEEKYGVVFCESIAHAEHFAQYLPQSAVYHSKNSSQQNAEYLRAFKARELRFLLAVNKLNEGVDIPEAQLLVFLRSTASQVIFLQQLGRGLRKEVGRVLVLDFVANCQRVTHVQYLARQVQRAVVVEEERDEDTTGEGASSLTSLTLPHFHFHFSQEQMDILEVVRRLERVSLTIADIPHLLAEFHHEKNAPLTPETLLAGTGKKFWWQCMTCFHEWEASGSSRARGRGCPACAGKAVTSRNNMAVTYPHLAVEFHYEKNAPFKPEDLIAGTAKKLWWRCSTCPHEWKASGNRRASQGNGCPACAGRVVTSWNNMAITHPHFLAEFHYEKNAPLTPETLIAGTNKKLWWKCATCSHEWGATGSDRTQGMGCPACVGKAVTSRNNMAVTYPHLAVEFDLGKNAPLTPETLIAGTNKKLWWTCATCAYEWEASGNSRTSQGSGCPACGRKKMLETRRNNNKEKG